MYHTTGLTKDAIRELCAMIDGATGGNAENIYPPKLGLFDSVCVALIYMRRNRTEADLAETYGVSQPTISRAITGVTPVLKQVLAGYVPVAEDLDPREGYIVDGTLCPCWSWAHTPTLYSGKHKTTGLNLQVVCDQRGRLAWVSDPVHGHRHDSAALKTSGVLDTLDTNNWMGDKGYVGTGVITPIKKPAHRQLLDSEKEFNTSINRIRYQIERVIAHLKTWRILHTDYRRPLATFATTISAVIGLQFYKLSRE